MKVLILVCTSEKPPYDKFLRTQRKTWDSIEHPNVETVFYCGSGSNEWEGNLFRSDCPHGYYTQHWKHKQAIDAVWDKEWDIIFRTHSSSYVNKARLYKLCESLPTEKLYGGWVISEADRPGEIVSGAGVFYSRDVADVLRKNIPEGINIEEDVLSARILRAHGFEVTFRDHSRCDYPEAKPYDPEAYHYRIKTDHRQNDIESMFKLHETETGINLPRL